MAPSEERKGVAGRWVKARRERRLALLKAAAEVYAEYGYENSSMRMLAAAANVTKVTLYAHLGKKVQSFEAVFTYLLESLPSPESLPAGGAELRVQLKAAELHLRHPASKAIAGALARSIHAPKASVESWHQRNALLTQYVEDALSNSTNRDSAKQAAKQLMDLLMSDLIHGDAIGCDASVGIVDIFVRAYDATHRVSDGAARQQ